MSDRELQRKATIKKILFGCALMLLLSAGLWYFLYSTGPELEYYESQKRQEASVQNQVNTLSATNAQLTATIEENGKELVSFTEDKIKYINLASELSLKYGVVINKLTVSDVWQEGEMSGMTTSIEVQGSLDSVNSFIEDYCGSKYTNRIKVVSCRPIGRYAWLSRSLDGVNVLTWFDLSEEEAMQKEQERSAAAAAIQQQVANEFGLPVVDVNTLGGLQYTYDPETQKFIYTGTGIEVGQDVLDETPISLDKMFSDTPLKAYLEIDFLGRS